MTIELLTKDEIINIKEFPNDIKNRLSRFMSAKQVDVIMELIGINRKEDVLFLTELNKTIKTIKNEKLKLIYFMSTYLIKKDILDKEPIYFNTIENYDDSLESKIYTYLFSKYTGKRYKKELDHKEHKSRLYKLIEDSIEVGIYDNLYARVLYIESYKHWSILIDSIADILITNGIIKIGE